jgi:hypothetical protein
MEIHQLRYFVAAAECGNISRAAERCHVANLIRERSFLSSLLPQFRRRFPLPLLARNALPRVSRMNGTPQADPLPPKARRHANGLRNPCDNRGLAKLGCLHTLVMA